MFVMNVVEELTDDAIFPNDPIVKNCNRPLFPVRPVSSITGMAGEGESEGGMLERFTEPLTPIVVTGARVRVSIS